MGRKRDRFWNYAEKQGNYFKCNFCDRVFPGGATRIKAHLAGVSGYDIVACVKVNQDVQKEAQETQKSNKKLKSASSTSSAGKRKITSASKIKDKIVTESEEEFEIILDDIVDGLVTNVISLVTEHTNFDWDFKDKEELKNLFRTLYTIQVMLPEAQERQVSDESVKIWLTELKDVVYDVDNVLDKFRYKILGQKVHIQNQMMNEVPSISFSNFDEVKTIKHMLDKFVNDVDGLGLKIVNPKPKISLPNIDSLNDSEFIGRENGDDLFLKLKSTLDRLTIPSLKRCFLYWANFPKDYDITKDELIQHWMAQELLKPSKESMVMEDIGDKYFNTLIDKFPLQNAKKDEYGNIISCRMNDSVHDFVLSISKSKSSSSDNFSQVRSLFVGFDGQTTPGISFKGDGFTKLCTLILENADFGNILSEFKSLRVLMLYGYKRIELPETIGVLIHLRLLHISDSEIKYLPNSITKLFNLQTLRIQECPNFVDLPEDLSNLINLRHICIIDCEIAAPKNVGRLTCLQTLPDFCVGRDEGYQIKELGPLKNLRGEISICNLENVEDEEEAKSAKLKEKEILNLELYWNDYNSNNDEKVLEGLQPHPNLKSLTVSCYGGKKFPSWVGLSSLYHNLIEIKLRDCRECEEVPTLGQLPYLRVLEMEGMEKVRCIGSEFYFYSDGSYRNTLFPALRKLKLENLYELEEWKDAKMLTTADEVFPCLEELTLSYCTVLRDLPDSLHTCVSLQKLVVEDCPQLRSLPGVRSIIRSGIEEPPSGLQYLENGDCRRLPSSSTSSIHPSFQKLCLCDSLVVDGIQHFIEMEARLECYTSSVEYMDNGDCLPYSSSIQKLKLYGSLLLLDQIQYFIALKILWIQGFYEMVALPEWLGNLSSLQKLYIVDCNHLVHLPTEEAMRRLTQLKTLAIYDCPNLEDNERSKIDHIPFVDIKDSGRPDWSDFEDETNPGSWQEVCIWENN